MNAGAPHARRVYYVSVKTRSLFRPLEQQSPRVAAGRSGQREAHHRGGDPGRALDPDADDGDRVLGHDQP